VLVAPGTYVENINFLGKAITVKSKEGPDVTIIDGSNPIYPEFGSVAYFNNGEEADSVLDGFTLMNGKGTNFEYYPGSWDICGGGVFCYDSIPTILNNKICNNTAVSGGGIYCDDCSPTIIYNTISGNHAEHYGGGIKCRSASPELKYNKIVENSAGWLGGGYQGSGSSPTITNNTFIENTADNGGGLSINMGSFPEISKNIISGNKALNKGGGIRFINHAAPNVTDNLISNNEASYGGGICCTLASPTFMNNMVIGNFATNNGGALYLRSSYSRISNNTIAGNSADECGGGIYSYKFYQNNPVVENTILWTNSAPSGAEIFIGDSSEPATLDISYSNVHGGQACVFVDNGCTLIWGEGMIDANPRFIDPTHGDYHILYTSPCRDAGESFGGLPDHDFDNNPREVYGVVDIGADEFCAYLYCTGDLMPGGEILGKFIGLPGTSPVGLFIGAGVKDPPLASAWGDFFLEAPLMVLPLVPIGPDGILVIPETIPELPVAPYDIPMQALIGWELSNLFVLEVR